jgi:hypothetical protein
MNRNIPARLRAPIRVLVVGAVITAVLIATRGWVVPVYGVFIPFVVLVAAGYYVWGGRDNDSAATLRREVDERQQYRRLKVQALVGRVMSLAAAIAYLVAVGMHATLWPFAIAIAVPVATAVVGWLIYQYASHGDEAR